VGGQGLCFLSGAPGQAPACLLPQSMPSCWPAPILAVPRPRNPPVTVNVSDVTPLPVNVSLNGVPLPSGANLLRPLIKVWGGKVAELDGTPSTEGYDELASHSEATWLAKYLPLDSSYSGGLVSFPVSDALQEGYYNVSATVSLITGYPSLVDLVGLNQITQDDETATGAGVSGTYEAATSVVIDHALVGVQKASTPTTLSAISCANQASVTKVTAGDALELSWKFTGVGSATCAHDGAPVSNAPNGTCVSPLTVHAGDVAASAAHKVTVTFTDVCGRTRTAEFQYTAAGVQAVTPTEVLKDDGTIQIITLTGGGSPTNRTSTGGAGARRAARAGSVVAGALGALALLAALA
jgi:hypothetical protein